jgi:hypothetical protein
MKLLEMDDIRKLPSDYEGIKSCIYFLWKGDDLQYIGGTRNIWTRMHAHSQSLRYGSPFQTKTVVPYDRVTCLACTPDEVFDLEPAYLQKFETPYNHMLAKNRE